MGRICTIIILIVALTVITTGWAAGQENGTLEALERVRTGLGQGISYRDLSELLDEARVLVASLEKDEVDDCFHAAVNESYYWYDLGRKTWETMMKNAEQRDKYFRQAAYGEHGMKSINMTMARNYDKLVKHTQNALPTRWEYGSAALEQAHRCLGP